MIAGPKAGQWYDHEHQIGGGPRDFIRLKGGIADDWIDEWLDRQLGISKPNGHDRSAGHRTAKTNPRIVATYDYQDEHDVLLFQVIRYKDPKDFRQRRPHGRAGWIWSTKGVQKVLYRLPQLLSAPLDQWVFVVEGEKDADRVAADHLIATTNPGGAAKRKDDGTPGKSKWRDEYNEAFANRRVCILPDADDPGHDHAKSVAENLVPIAERVVVVDLPGLPEKGDVSDWFDAGHTRDELVALANAATPIPEPTADEVTRAKVQAEWDRQRAALDTLIREFNRRYAVVNEAGKVVVFERVLDPSVNRYRIDRFTFADFKKLYQNEPLTVTFVGADNKPKSITKTAAEWWLNHPDRRQYLGGVVCDPTGTAPASYWNLWSGFGDKPAPGYWSLMREHIRKVICSGNPKHDDYLMNWLARLFQHPEERAEVAIVMRGVEGVGKGLLGRLVARAFGQHGMQISSSAHLVGNFNAHLRDLIVLFADEAFFAGDRQHEGRLKALITEETLTIEGKYQNVISVRNMLHIIMASNADWVVPASLRARRWFMLDVPDTHHNDFGYFVDIVNQMESGGLAAMIYDLLGRDISNFNPRDVPKTDALAEQQLYSLDSLHRWWLTVLSRGFVYRSRHGVPSLREWRDFYTTKLLWRSYLQWSDETRANRRQTREDLGKFMSQAYQSGRPRAAHPVYEIDVVDVDTSAKRGTNWLDKHAVVCKEHQIGYTVGTLQEARVSFTTICNVPTEWGLQPGGQGE